MMKVSYSKIEKEYCVIFSYNGEKIIDIYYDGLSLWGGMFDCKDIDVSSTGRVKVMDLPDLM